MQEGGQVGESWLEAQGDGGDSDREGRGHPKERSQPAEGCAGGFGPVMDSVVFPYSCSVKTVAIHSGSKDRNEPTVCGVSPGYDSGSPVVFQHSGHVRLASNAPGAEPAARSNQARPSA